MIRVGSPEWPHQTFEAQAKLDAGAYEMAGSGLETASKGGKATQVTEKSVVL